MCLAVPARIESIEGTSALVMALGCREKIDIRFVPTIEVGDFVLVHVGFALEKVRPKEAAFLLDAWNSLLANEGISYELPDTL
ncbi:MAG: HypC/HybG/HupF family hydrogenase formation chaperone [Firmicutes bacterium]|nr:HypC/HybG/HupF family hydrogenase formation chaperone [Bacillota bacterium]